MSDLPAVVSVPIFLLTIPFFLLFVSWGKKTEEYPSAKRAKHRKGLLSIGVLFIAIECSLLINMRTAGADWFGWLFTWFCGHGGPALFVLRNVIGLTKLVIKGQ